MIPGGVIDSHLHLWDLNQYRYPWLDDPECAQLRSNYLVEDYLHDARGIDIAATVHVQAELDHAVDPAEETAWLSRLAPPGPTDAPVPTVCIGYADLRAPDLPDLLDRHERYSIFRGIRQEAWYDPRSRRADLPTDNLLADPAWVRGLRQLAERRLVFELLVWPWQLEQAAAIFSELPDLPIVLEHTGLPPADARERWRAGMQAFAAQVPSAVLKISALRFASPTWDRSHITSVVHQAIDIFGPSRCLLGSNFPVDKPAISYRDFWRALDAMTSHLSADERAAIFRTNSARVYRIDLANPDRGRSRP